MTIFFVLDFQLRHLQDVASAVGTFSWEKPHMGSDLQLTGTHVITRGGTAPAVEDCGLFKMPM
jgi:hypothetical protein